tara:strand:+ start:505 stop:855 length:351 start_codon:yes stop_codon:yes gene_type:complete
LEDSITARRQVALVAAIVVIDLIAIVTGFHTVVDDVITAFCVCTTIGAIIAIHCVGVVTSLIAFFTKVDVGSHDTVATAGELTAVSTGIQIILIAIVAGFARLKDLITAGGIIAEI